MLSNKCRNLVCFLYKSTGSKMAAILVAIYIQQVLQIQKEQTELPMFKKKTSNYNKDSYLCTNFYCPVSSPN